MRKTVAFGFVGTVLDYAGRGSQRWSKVKNLRLCRRIFISFYSDLFRSEHAATLTIL